MAAYHAVIVDDEVSNLESLSRVLKSDGGSIEAFTDPHEALSYVRQNPVDVLLTDLRMGRLTGMELLETLKTVDPSLEVVLMTAFGTVELAVEAMKKGAYDFITKPLQRIQVLKAVHKALERRLLVTENRALKEELKLHASRESHELIGKSNGIRSVLDVARQAAQSKANVLIQGESGTGKGVLAEFIHKHSDAREGLFVKINCAAIPENLLEAELFGFEAGAFTGAARRKKGRVELAQAGTLFLDEIGIAPVSCQTKLLRFVQEGEFERLGSNTTLKVDTRVISATNVDLQAAIRAGQFREDLYYRLNVIHIPIPSLRDRIEDVPLLTHKFLEESARKNGRSVPILESEVVSLLLRYPWPGNIRELQNLMERLVVLSRDGNIRVKDLPPELGKERGPTTLLIPLGMSLREIERLVMDETLKIVNGDKRLAANMLGIHPRTIYRHLEQFSYEKSSN